MDESNVSRSSFSTKKRLSIVSYVCQVAAIFVVIVGCVVNLSIGDDKSALWASLLSGALGYLLPAPKIKKNESSLLPDASEQ